MATRARELLDRSRVLLDRSRAAAAQFLATPSQAPVRPRIIEAPSVAPPPSAAVQQDALAGVCASVALRDLNLVDALLAQLEEMEAREEDSQRLGELYRLDHLATRLRRNAENLRVLAGRDDADDASETTSVVDVVRAAMSSIDQYTRVSIGRVVQLGVVGFAAEDLSRLLAEVLDNATGQSSPNAAVRVSAHLTEQGSVLLRIEDEGIGVPAERLAELNQRLEADPVLDDESVRHMGLAVVRRLAARHGMRVRLERRVPHGTTAIVVLPVELVAELPETAWSGGQTVVFPQPGVPQPGTPQNGTPGPPVPAPVPINRRAENARGRLPRRTAGATGAASTGRTATAEPLARRRPSPRPTGQGGTTLSGLPRRVPGSIKGSAEESAPPADTPPAESGHDRLIADLGDFAEGERAALEGHAGPSGAADEKPAKGTLE